MSITGVKSYSTANLQGENSIYDVATINARLTEDETAIAGLQQSTTGISYSNAGSIDLTTISNNLTITGTLTTTPTLASQTYVNSQISALVASAPSTLDTLNELATALGNDPNFATTTASLIGSKASLSATQTITGINTLSNPLNVLYGDGSNLTGIVSSTITVADSNLGTTYYPVFATANAGAKSLFFDNITSPLQYTPSTGTLQTTTFKAGTASFQNVGINTQIINSSNGGPIQLFCNTAGGVQVGNFSLSATQLNLSVPISSTQSISNIIPTVGNNVSIQTGDASGNFIYIVPRAYTGGYNSTSVAGDSLIFAQETATGTGVLNLTSWGSTAVGVRITPTAVVISGNASFASIPSCSIAPTTANHLTNKTYVDTAVSSGLTNYVTTNTVQTITANKTFSNANIMMDNGSTQYLLIYQNGYQSNLCCNTVNIATATATGFIPSTNLFVFVRTDSASAIQAGGAISGIAIPIPYSNFYLASSTVSTPAIAVISLTQIQCNTTLAIGDTLSSFIGVRFTLGTCVASGDLGGGVYNLNTNALGASFTKDTTTVIRNTLNRAYRTGGMIASVVLFDWNTSLNLQVRDITSNIQNALNITQGNIIANIPLRMFNTFSYLTKAITATMTLTAPLAQFYTINTTLAITITFPTVDLTMAGISMCFRRYGTTGGTVTFGQTGGASVMVPFSGLVGVASVSIPTGIYTTYFMCDGVSWFQISIN